MSRTIRVVKGCPYPLAFSAALVLIWSCGTGAPTTPTEPGGAVTSELSALLTRGQSQDLIADVQVGKRDFAEISPREIVPDKLSAPGGITVDRSVSPGLAYIWDSGNSRILGIDLAACYAARAAGNRCTAGLVFGQPSASDHGACNRDSSFQTYPNRPASSATTLCGMPESTHTTLEDKSFANMHVDAQGNLWVPDMGNNRVLKFVRPFATDVVADGVWGQPTFAGNLCNQLSSAAAPTASTLCFNSLGSHGGGVRFDAAGNLWVADGGNNRVLRFPVQAGVISKTANLVLGQPNFTSGGDWSSGTALNRMHSPNALVFDAAGRLYVADEGNARVLVFQPPFTNGMAASVLLTFPSGNGPKTLEADPDGRGLWVTNHQNWDTQLRLFSFAGAQLYQAPSLSNHGGGSIGFDAQKRLLATSYVYGQDVHRLTPQANGTYVQDLQLFSPPGGYNLTTGRRFEHPAWVGVTVTQNQLVVSDGRLLFWNNPTTVTQGKAPDGFVGAASITAVPNPGFGQVKSDASGRIYASRATEIRVYQAPLSTGASPIKTISSVNALGGGVFTFTGTDEVHGLVPSPDGKYLWISQPRSHRVLRIRDPLTASAVVDVVLGQTSQTGRSCNRGLVPPPNSGTSLVADLNMLCHPGALSLDRRGNLYVSDHFLEAEGNWRMLMFKAGLFPAAPASMLYAPAASKEWPRSGVPGFPHSHMTFEPAFDSTNRMVVGFNPYSGKRFVQYYDDPTRVNPSNPRDPAYAVPSGQLVDFYGWAVGAAFDGADNLYVYDANRGRVMIYFQPFKYYRVTGAVGIHGSDMLGPNRLTQGPCPSQSFITASSIRSTIEVTEGGRSASWDCAAPEFFFGSAKGERLQFTPGTRTFRFKPPGKYRCQWYTLYGTRDSDSFTANADGSCTVSVTMSQPSELYLWYYVTPLPKYRVTGAVGVEGSDMLGPNRVTQGPCPGKPFITGSTVQVNNAELGAARWDCTDPAFWFGDFKSQSVPLTLGNQQFTFTPPAGYRCSWYTAYGTRHSESFTSNGSSCTVTLGLSANPGDVYIWYYVQRLPTGGDCSCPPGQMCPDVECPEPQSVPQQEL